MTATVHRVARNILLWILLAAAVAAVIGYSRYRQDVHAARERIAAGSQMVSTPCGAIEYAVRGTGPPLLVVHGAGGGFDQGLLIAERLIGAGYQAIAMSRFGYLRTPMPPDATAAAQADAHACLLDALKLARVAVVGASAGAPSVLQMAIRHPDRVSALIVLVPATYMPGAGGAGAEMPPGLSLMFDTILKWDFPFWLAIRVARKTLVRTLLGTPPQLLEQAGAQEGRSQVARMLQYVLPVSLRRQGLLNDGAVTATLQRFALERIRAPTLIISAQDDGFGTFERARYTAAQIPGARFVGYPSGGHLLVGREVASTAAMLTLLQQSQTPF